MQLTFIFLLGALAPALLVPTKGAMLVPDLAGVLDRAMVTADEMLMVAIAPTVSLDHLTCYKKSAGVLEALGATILILYIIKTLINYWRILSKGENMG
jgi:hypothetical protein